MATGKKFYWIKLRKDFMSGDIVDFLMSQRNGAQYVVLYQMLCMMCINTKGALSRQIGELIVPFDTDKIQRDCKYFSRDTITIALELFKKVGLVYEQEEGGLAITGFDNLVGCETDYAIQKRQQRQLQDNAVDSIEDNSMDSNADNCADSNMDNVMDSSKENSVDIVHTEIEKEFRVKRLEKDIDTEKEKDIEIDKNTICPEVETSAQAVFISLPLVTGSGSFDVTFNYLNSLRQLYPAVDVEQEFRKMYGWLDSNPRNRKTSRGIKRFITSWLGRAQDRAPITRTATTDNRRMSTGEYMQNTADWYGGDNR